MPATTTNIKKQEGEPNETEIKALKKLKFTSGFNKACVISLSLSLAIMLVTAITMIGQIIANIALMFEEDDKLSGFLKMDVMVGRFCLCIFVPFAIVSGLLMLIYSIVLRVNEGEILEIMSNANLEKWYEDKKIGNNSLYLFRYMYNQYTLDKLKTKLNSKQKNIFQGLYTVLYSDRYCLDDMQGFVYELYMGSFFDILIRLSVDPSEEVIEEIINDYSKERNLEDLKKRNKKNIKKYNSLRTKSTWKLFFYILKVGMLATMILWLIIYMFFPEEYGVFLSNYFNICAVYLLGSELWERRKDILIFHDMDDFGTKKKQ